MARFARWPAAIHKGFGAANNVFKRTCSGMSRAVLVVTMATPKPRFHSRHQTVHTIIFSGDGGALAMVAQPAGDDVPIFRVVALAENEQRAKRHFGGRHTRLPGKRMMAVHRQSP